MEVVPRRLIFDPGKQKHVSFELDNSEGKTEGVDSTEDSDDYVTEMIERCMLLQRVDNAIAASENIDLESCMIVQENLFKLDSKEIAQLMFTDGVIYGRNREECFVSRILFDTGALHHSYISEDIVKRDKVGCCANRRPVSVSVKLGDSKT